MIYSRNVSEAVTFGNTREPHPEFTMETPCIIEGGRKLISLELKTIMLCVPFIYSSNNP
jgi:hypothetical protein